MKTIIKKIIPLLIIETLRSLKAIFYDNLKKMIVQSMLYYPYISNLVSLMHSKRFIRKKIKWIDEMQCEVTLQNEKTSLIYPPDYGKGSSHIKIVLPKINMYLLNNVYGSANSSSFYDNELLYLERLQGSNDKDTNYSSGHLLIHNSNNGLIRGSKFINIDKCVLFLGGNGSFNYFHWIIEILPKLLFIDNNIIKTYGIEVIFMNNKVIEISNFKIALDLISKNLGLDFIYADQENTIHFKKVVYITTFNHVLYNSKTNQINMYDNYFDKKLLVKFRELILQSHEFGQIESNKNYPKRLFLLRGSVGNHNKRDYNEKEIYSYLQSKGFIGVKVEEYNFIEQAFLFNNAEYIVGPSGAFWANLIFCIDDTKVISWLPQKVKDFSVYSTIANYFGINMKFINAESLDDNLHGRYLIDIIDLLKILDSEMV